MRESLLFIRTNSELLHHHQTPEQLPTSGSAETVWSGYGTLAAGLHHHTPQSMWMCSVISNRHACVVLDSVFHTVFYEL